MAESTGKGARPSQAEKESISSPKHCQACGTAVKDHSGPHGPQRCLVGLVGALRERIDALEQQSARQDEQLRRKQDLHIERRNALLATIDVLEERIAHLEKASPCASKVDTTVVFRSPSANASNKSVTTKDTCRGVDDGVSVLDGNSDCSETHGSDRSVQEPRLGANSCKPPGSLPELEASSGDTQTNLLDRGAWVNGPRVLLTKGTASVLGSKCGICVETTLRCRLELRLPMSTRLLD